MKNVGKIVGSAKDGEKERSVKKKRRWKREEESHHRKEWRNCPFYGIVERSKKKYKYSCNSLKNIDQHVPVPVRTTTADPQEVQYPDGWIRHDGYLFKYFDSEVKWDNASEKCQ